MRLSDNGSAYAATPTRNFAEALNLVLSLESDGGAKAFVKTFKRNDARINPLPDAAIVLRQI